MFFFALRSFVCFLYIVVENLLGKIATIFIGLGSGNTVGGSSSIVRKYLVKPESLMYLFFSRKSHRIKYSVLEFFSPLVLDFFVTTCSDIV